MPETDITSQVLSDTPVDRLGASIDALARTANERMDRDAARIKELEAAIEAALYSHDRDECTLTPAVWNTLDKAMNRMGVQS